MVIIMDKNNIEKLFYFYEKYIESCIIKIKNSNNKNIYIDNLIKKIDKIDTMDSLINLLNIFFDKRKKYEEYKDYITNYIINNYNNIINNKDNSFIIEFNNYKKKILSNNEINKEYIILYSNNYWAQYAFKNKLSKKELISLAKLNNCNDNDILLLEKSLKFINIPSEDDLKEYKDELNNYNQIIYLKNYIENWRTIKTNQINNSSLKQDEKIKCFQELENDYANLVIYYDTSYKDIQKIFELINSRDYIKILNINHIISNKKEPIENNSIQKELMIIKEYQEKTNKPKSIN